MSEPVFERLRTALAARKPAPVELPAIATGMTFRPAAVLVPLFLRGQEVHLVLTQRAKDLKRHAGQVSFPGGSAEPGDFDRRATALREASEEIGLRSADCDVLGQLDPSPVITLFEITPVVARIPPATVFSPSPAEVERVIVLPLRPLLDPAALEVREREAFGQRHRILYYRSAGEEVWGATARILEQLLTVVGPLL